MSSLEGYEGRLCCAICGDAILSLTSKLDEETRWQADAVLISDPTRGFEQLEEHYRGGKRQDAPQLNLRTAQDIRKDRARLTEGDCLRIVDAEDNLDPGDEVRANYSYGREENGEWASTPYSIATHAACLEVAESAMRRSPHDIVVRDLRTLWKVLRMRFEVDDSYYMSTVSGTVSRPQRIRLPHSYYIAFRPSDMIAGYSPNDAADLSSGPGSKISRWEAAYPLHVPNATSAILENLNTLPPASTAIPEAVSFQKKFLGLPRELQDHICSFLVSRNGMPNVCNGLLPQWVWREVLLGGKCLPFMQDIDVTIVDEFCAQWGRNRKDQEPNWELLVRKLSQEAWGIWDAENSILKVPNGLRNRRRIWKLVEEMYVGDLVPVKRVTGMNSDAVAVPRYWDERGELVHPVARVSVGSRGK
ncbi:uncharacterized protein F4822DRAFT_342171 [Hypoxylon trugodes]|uniref:uncharacterized protein n=1 Tax=Hypoxylon trugodes TaxID=326681 RepID=UPI002197A9A7|nr:uncharacterized protein F4822DRAFT_342171 [Hypoxylon trugodes]KAI1385359.1 hypothetical protein F4822DRAFT_342171 [Hypoxylon trugodes]